MDGLAELTQLTSLNLFGCSSLQNVDGLANCAQLTDLNLYGCSALENVDGLANCTQLTSLDLRGCSELHPKPPRRWELSTRKAVAAYQEFIKSTMAAR